MKEKKKIPWGLIYVGLTVVVMIVFGLVNTEFAGMFSVIANLSLGFVALAVLMTGVFLVTEGGIIHMLLRAQGEHVGFWTTVKIGLIGIYYSYITPSSTGDIVTVNVDENGKRLNRDFLYRRSDRIRRELEQKYGLHPAERKNQRLDNPLRKVAASAGDVKKQVGNTVKALNGQYRFQTMGEYRALLSLYNMTVEEARGNVRGREYHGLVYSVTDDKGNKVGNPFKSSLFGKSAGYEAVQKKFVRSKSEIKDRYFS